MRSGLLVLQIDTFCVEDVADISAETEVRFPPGSKPPLRIAPADIHSGERR